MAKKKQLDFDAYKKEFPGIEKIKELNDKHKALIHASNILRKAEDCVVSFPFLYPSQLVGRI